MSEKKHVAGKWEISIEPEPWDAYFYIGYEHGDTRAPMGLQEGLKYFNTLEAANAALTSERDEVVREREAAFTLLARIRLWDHLESAGDGPYWRREIDEMLTHTTGRSESRKGTEE